MLNYRLESFFLAGIAFFFMLEHAIVAAVPALTYADELFAILASLMVLLNLGRLDSDAKLGLLLCVGLLIVGVIGNVSFGLLTNVPAIIVDIISTFKVFVCFYFVCALSPCEKIVSETIHIGVVLSKIFVVVAFIFMVISQFIDIGMTAGERYGFASYSFVYAGIPGNFSKAFYLVVPLLVFGLREKAGFADKTILALALITWCGTMRSRAFAFVGCTLLLMVWFIWLKPSKGGIKRIRLIHIVVVSLVALAVVWDQLVFYFTNDTQARANLLRFAIVTACTYFPIGAGFGTYGSNVAAELYSPLYQAYGFNLKWGMSQDEGMFLNDNYWPMIIGQFGVIGTVLVVGILCLLFKSLLVQCRKNSSKGAGYTYLSVVLIIGFLLLSSAASKSYSEFSSMGVFIYMALIFLNLKYQNKKQDGSHLAGNSYDDKH